MEKCPAQGPPAGGEQSQGSNPGSLLLTTGSPGRLSQETSRNRTLLSTQSSPSLRATEKKLNL